jgi:hypothetical protein
MMPPETDDRPAFGRQEEQKSQEQLLALDVDIMLLAAASRGRIEETLSPSNGHYLSINGRALSNTRDAVASEETIAAVRRCMARGWLKSAGEGIYEFTPAGWHAVEDLRRKQAGG